MNDIDGLTQLLHDRETTAHRNRLWFASPGWIEGSRLGVPDSWPGQANAIFLNTYTGVCTLAGGQVPVPPPNTWQPVDLKPLGIPPSALAVHLSGFLIITSGLNSRAADLAVSFAKPGALSSDPVDSYIAQAVCVGPLAGAAGGIRTNFGVTVPLINGELQWGWCRGDYPTWTTGTWPDLPIPLYPDGASYGLNISVQGYLLP